MLNEKKNNSISIKDSDELSRKDAAVSTDSRSELDNGQTSARSTYETFSWLLIYTRMFTRRLFKDLLISLVGYLYTGQIVPNHIVTLLSVQKSLLAERDSQTVTYMREIEAGHLSDRLPSVMIIFSAFKRYILCSEDDVGLQSSARAFEFKDKEPMFVIVDSSCISNPSSQELLIENKKGTVLKKHFRHVIPIGVPSTSRDIISENIRSQFEDSESTDELQMIEINLQSENEIPVENDESDNESIVVSYLQNKDLGTDLEGLLISTKKKSSLLEDVPKMETILEGEQFSSFPLKSPASHELPPEAKPEEDPE